MVNLLKLFDDNDFSFHNTPNTTSQPTNIYTQIAAQDNPDYAAMLSVINRHMDNDNNWRDAFLGSVNSAIENKNAKEAAKIKAENDYKKEQMKQDAITNRDLLKISLAAKNGVGKGKNYEAEGKLKYLQYKLDKDKQKSAENKTKRINNSKLLNDLLKNEYQTENLLRITGKKNENAVNLENLKTTNKSGLAKSAHNYKMDEQNNAYTNTNKLINKKHDYKTNEEDLAFRNKQLLQKQKHDNSIDEMDQRLLNAINLNDYQTTNKRILEEDKYSKTKNLINTRYNNQKDLVEKRGNIKKDVANIYKGTIDKQTEGVKAKADATKEYGKNLENISKNNENKKDNQGLDRINLDLSPNDNTTEKSNKKSWYNPSSWFDSKNDNKYQFNYNNSTELLNALMQPKQKNNSNLEELFNIGNSFGLEKLFNNQTQDTSARELLSDIINDIQNTGEISDISRYMLGYLLSNNSDIQQMISNNPMIGNLLTQLLEEDIEEDNNISDFIDEDEYNNYLSDIEQEMQDAKFNEWLGL